MKQLLQAPLKNGARVAYILKMYPRFSETFIVNEILAHEKSGLGIDIFSLRTPTEGCFHEILAQVNAKVTYVPDRSIKANVFWEAVRQAVPIFPKLWQVLSQSTDHDIKEIHQAILIAEEIKRKNINHLHAHFGNTATAVARLVSLICEIPYSFTTHAKDIFHEEVVEWELARKLNDAAHVVTVSKYNLRYLREKYGTATKNLVKIYNGLDLERFPFQAPHKRENLILSIGRLVEKKGFPILISACAQLRKRGVSFKCVIVGQGEQEAELREIIRNLDLHEHVELAGPKPQVEVIKLIKQASVFAAPFVVGKDGNRDGLPTVLLESMALGTPCVSTDVTGVPEVLIDKVTGLLVPQNNAIALADAIEKLLNNPELRVEYAIQARQLIESNFDIHKNAADLRNLFQVKEGRLNSDLTLNIPMPEELNTEVISN